MQAAWLLTIAFGNLIVLIIAEVNGIPRQVTNNDESQFGNKFY